MPKQARLSGNKSFRTYKIEEAAEVSGVSTRTISNWAANGLHVMDGERPFLIRGDNLSKLDADEIVRVCKILKHGETLVKIAKYEEAKGLIGAKWRGLILGLSAVLAALVAFWTNIEKIAGKIAGLFQ